MYIVRLFVFLTTSMLPNILGCLIKGLPSLGSGKSWRRRQLQASPRVRVPTNVFRVFRTNEHILSLRIKEHVPGV